MPVCITLPFREGQPLVEPTDQTEATVNPENQGQREVFSKCPPECLL